MDIATVDWENYAEFRVTGHIDFGGLKQTLERVHEHCSDEGLKGAFVDLTSTTGTLDGMERFELAHALLPNWNREICLSIVIPAERAEPGQYGQLVAQNRGYRVRVFTQREPALGWIESAVS